MLTQLVGGRGLNAQQLNHIVGHFYLDLVKQPHSRRIKRVIKVKDPMGNMVKSRVGHKAGAKIVGLILNLLSR